MDFSHLLALLVALVLVVWNTWQHLGRSPAARAWGDAVQGELKVRSVLVIRPMLAVVLVGVALLGPTSDTGAGRWIALPVTVALVVALAYMVLPAPIPRWAQPSWFRYQRQRRSGRLPAS